MEGRGDFATELLKNGGYRQLRSWRFNADTTNQLSFSEPRKLKSPKNQQNRMSSPKTPENPRQKIRNSPKINFLRPEK
jgi:hypothetical protein